MICHKCQQDNIKIEKGHILCDICGLDIDISHNLEDELVDLFVFNKELQNSERLGVEAMREGRDLEDNPYPLSEIMLHKKWEKGYNKERGEYDLAALTFSAEKLEKQLNDEVIKSEKLSMEKEELIIDKEKLEDYFKLLREKKFFFGRTYRSYIEEIFKYISK